jgi:hypothetical protein
MFFSILFMISILFGEQEYFAYDYGEFSQGSTVYLYGDKVNVRQSPSIDANVVTTLTIGHPMEISGRSETMYTVNDYTTHWYNVRFDVEGKEMSGYVWGGLISIVSFPIGANGSEWFLLGVHEYDQEKGFIGQGRIMKNGKIVAQEDFPFIGGFESSKGTYSHSISGYLLDDAGFGNLENVILIDFIYEACGFANGTVVLFWTGEKLLYAIEGTSVSEAGLFHHYFNIYFPYVIEGSPNYLILVEKSEEYIDDQYERVETVVRLYYWDGKKLNQVYE